MPPDRAPADRKRIVEEMVAAYDKAKDDDSNNWSEGGYAVDEYMSVALTVAEAALARRPLNAQELQTSLDIRLATAEQSDGALRKLVSLAIRRSEPRWDQDLCVGEAMEGTEWLKEEHIQQLCDAAADAAIVLCRDALARREGEVRAEEREACAKACEQLPCAWGCKQAAAAIRACAAEEGGR